MKLKYEQGAVSFDLHGLLEMVPADQKRELVESLSCDTDLIDFVAQQIIDKWTENGYSGGAFVTAAIAPAFGLDKAWRDVAKASGEVAKREIARLEDALRRSEARCQELSNELAERSQRREYA